MVYLITYDLHKIKDYDRLHKSILALKDCIRPLDSFWLVNTSLSLTQLVDYIRKSVDCDDWFYVTPIASPGDGKLNPHSWDWINSKFIPPNTPGLKPLGLHKLQQQKFGKLPTKPR